jgi:Na+-translocating ferredoxin:NAD+ oxidoreductase RnfD subunit
MYDHEEISMIIMEMTMAMASLVHTRRQLAVLLGGLLLLAARVAHWLLGK